MTESLPATVVIDYQNVHLVGHDRFASTRALPRHETLVDPLLFAEQLIRERNARQKPGHSPAELVSVLVYRGLPSEDHDPKGYARNQAQKAHWERDPRVQVVLRPLKYSYQRTANGEISTDHAGKRLIKGLPREKGIDVLCALALVREAQHRDTVVVLASGDTDLIPALDEAQSLGQAKIETCSWYDPRERPQQLHPTDRSRPLWNTRMNEACFRASWDRSTY